MPNQIFQLLNGGNPGNGGGGNPFANPLQMMQQFNQFRQSFQGDPQQAVQQLLQSGRMSQQQFNQLSQIASEFQKLLR